MHSSPIYAILQNKYSKKSCLGNYNDCAQKNVLRALIFANFEINSVHSAANNRSQRYEQLFTAL